MSCEIFRFRDGSTAIVCSRDKRKRKPPRCVGCGAEATLLCDWPNPRKKSGTCDAPICRECASRPDNVASADRHDSYDLCPRHARQAAEQPGADPQLTLFR